ncbi:MAG: hypothetical protein ACYDA1_00900 [Vulcanimicrobiaceae bacterium]
MKKTYFILVSLLLLALPAYAQVTPVPSPTPDPHIYDDHGMHLVVPSDFVPLLRRSVHVAQLGPKLEPLAAWGKRTNDGLVTITLMAEGDVESGPDWLVTLKNEIRGQIDNVFIKNSDYHTLKNGMPAYWVSMNYGSGFSSRKREGWAWSDGRRGIFLSIDFPLDAITDKQATDALADVRATMYPTIQE